MLLDATDRFFVKTYYEHPKTMTKKERAIAREIIKEITYSAIAGIPIKNVRSK